MPLLMGVVLVHDNIDASTCSVVAGVKLKGQCHEDIAV